MIKCKKCNIKLFECDKVYSGTPTHLVSYYRCPKCFNSVEDKFGK